MLCQKLALSLSVTRLKILVNKGVQVKKPIIFFLTAVLSFLTTSENHSLRAEDDFKRRRDGRSSVDRRRGARNSPNRSRLNRNIRREVRREVRREESRRITRDLRTRPVHRVHRPIHSRRPHPANRVSRVTRSRGPVVFRDYRRDRHLRYHHRPHWNRPSHRYTRNYHRPYRALRNHRRRFLRRFDYHVTIPYRFIYWDTWVRYRVSFNDGYVLVDGYPYFVYNGYRHRYSPYDNCDYDLVDGHNNQVEQTFYGYTCSIAYDYCADLRDDLNFDNSGYRYFCSERLDLGSVRYDHWDNEFDFYYDLN